MLLSIFGTPSALTYAGSTIVRAIADCAAGSHAFIQGVFLDDVKKAWTTIDRSKTPAVVLFSDFPSTPLVELIRANRAPIVVFLDDFAEVVHHSLETHNISILEALRLSSQVICTLGSLKADHVLRVTSDDFGNSLADLIFMFCEFFGLRDPGVLTDRVLARLGYSEVDLSLREYVIGKRPRIISNDTMAARKIPVNRSIIEFVVSQYSGIVSGNLKNKIIWPPELFLDSSRLGMPLDGAIELLGPARFLIYGPYMHLPEGNWIAKVVFELYENFSGNRLCVDVCSREVLGGATMKLPSSGSFEFLLPFRVQDPSAPVELRFQSLVGAIEGKFILRHVILTPEGIGV